MKNGIPSDKYYFLLEWKDANMEDFLNMKGLRRMCDLTTYELNKLYEAIKASETETTHDANNKALNLQRVVFSEERAEVCACGRTMEQEAENKWRCVCGRGIWIAQT